MALFEGLLDREKYTKVLDICLKDGDLEHEELDALSRWTAIEDGIKVPVLSKVLKIRECLSSPITSEDEKEKLIQVLAEEKKSFSSVSPAIFPKVDPSKPSEALVNALNAYVASIILESHKLYIDVIENKDSDALINSSNPMIRRGIGYALFEMASQASNRISSNQNIILNHKTIINETLEGTSRGVSESVINNLVPEKYQAAAKIAALGVIRSSFNAIVKGHDLPNWLITACGSGIAGVLSNNITTYIGKSVNAEDKKKMQEYIDFANTVIVKSTVQGLSSKSIKTAMYTLLTATAKDGAFKLAGGVDALKDRNVASLMQAALPLDVLKKIIDASTALFSNVKLPQVITNIGGNDTIPLINLALDIHNFSGNPNVETAQKLYTDTTHFISIKCGFTYGSIVLAALDVGSKAYQGKYKEAGYSAVEHAAYMAAPIITKAGDSQAIAFVCGAMVSAYAAYELINYMNAKTNSNEQHLKKDEDVQQKIDSNKDLSHLDENMKKAIEQAKESNVRQAMGTENKKIGNHISSPFLSPQSKSKKEIVKN